MQNKLTGSAAKLEKDRCKGVDTGRFTWQVLSSTA